MSLSPDIEKMWIKYAGNDTGYCIEYDLSDYKNHNVFPVIYNDEREMNVIEVIASDYIGLLVSYFSDGRIMGAISSYFRLFLSKHNRWVYQKGMEDPWGCRNQN